MDVNTGEYYLFYSSPKDDSRPSWSPDGEKIAFDSGQPRMDGNADIYVLDANGKNLKKLTDHPKIDAHAHWSPDGKRIAFTSEESGNRDIWIMEADGSNKIQVTFDPGIDVWPRWSPDGRKIAYGSQRKTKTKTDTHIWIIDLEKQLGFAQLPFEMKSGYLVFSVPIEPSGSLSFLFDTGCQITTIGKDVLENANREQAITLLLGTRKLKINDYRINPQTSPSKTPGKKIDGVIGNDILHRYTVKIDFNKRVLSLFDNEGLTTYPNGDDVGIEVNSLVSSVPLKITFPGGQQVAGEFMIDLGAPINLVINSPVAEQYGLHKNLNMSKEKEFRTQADVQTAAAVLTESVRIGKFECVEMEIYISTSKKGLFAGSKYAGIVGNKFFQNFNVIFDYKRKRLHVVKY